jgi:hypothetical protein
MIILLKGFYIVFFGCVDLILYSLLNQKGWVKKNQLMIYGTLFIIVVILHTGIVKIDFLMPKDSFFHCTVFLLLITIMHFFGLLGIKRIGNPNNRVSEEIKEMFRKFWAFCTMIIPYFFFFAIQCVYSLIF